MNSQRVLYEANLRKEGKSLKRALVVLIITGVVGIVFFLGFSNKVFGGNLGVLVLLGIFVCGMVIKFREISQWSGNPGRYRIYLDSIGLHVHSDEPALGRSFSIAAINLHQLVRKRAGGGEDVEYEYFIEEKSGARYQLAATFVNYDMDAMAVFETIAGEFPSVKIVSE